MPEYWHGLGRGQESLPEDPPRPRQPFLLSSHSRISQLLPPPRSSARDSRLTWSSKNLISMPTSSLVYIPILHLPKSPPASILAAAWPPMDLLGHHWDLGRTLKGHRAQRVLLPLVRPTPNVTHTSWFLGGSKSIKILFFVSLRMEHRHGRVKGETRSSVFLLELGLLGCKSRRAWKSHWDLPSP